MWQFEEAPGCLRPGRRRHGEARGRSQPQGDRYVARFRDQGKEYKKSLKTTRLADARAAMHGIERAIHGLATGMLHIAAGGCLPEPVPGDPGRFLDGQVLAGTDPQIDERRPARAATRRGQSLAVDEPAGGLVRGIVPEGDAHTQERAPLDQVAVEPGQLWIMDRNFCVRMFLFDILRREAFFLVRRHASTSPFEPLRSLGRGEGGDLSARATSSRGGWRRSKGSPPSTPAGPW